MLRFGVEIPLRTRFGGARAGRRTSSFSSMPEPAHETPRSRARRGYCAARRRDVGEPIYRGEIKNQRKSLLRLIRALGPNGEVVSFCYEAGACGYGVYREIVETGHRCEVVAPSLIPRRSGERVKTETLAGRLRDGSHGPRSS